MAGSSAEAFETVPTQAVVEFVANTVLNSSPDARPSIKPST